MDLTWHRAFGLIVLFFAAQWLLANLVAVGASLFAALSDTSFERIKASVETSRGLIACVAASGVVLLMLRKYLRDARACEVLGLRLASSEDIALALASGLAIGAFYANLAGFLADTPTVETIPGASSPDASMFAWFLFALVIAPPVEEFLFRGVLQGVIDPLAGQWLTIGAVTDAFAVVHLPETFNSGPALLGVASMAVAAGWFRSQSRSLIPRIAVHLGYNMALASAVGASLWL